ILRGLNSDSVDLIYLDPPFNSNRNYQAPVGSKAAGAAFKDAWTLDDVDEAQHGLIAEAEPPLYEAINPAGIVHGKGMKSYLIMMGVRLLEMRRVLRDTGSIYLHCDPTAGHYLKLLMDSVFSVDGFKNEIVWHYRRWTGKANRFQRLHDTIFFYGQTDSTFNVPYEPYTDKSLKRKQNYHTRIKDGDVYVTSIDERGVRAGDVWQIPVLNSQAKERVGYPTQKPIALLERIIQASSNPGDVILDPFAGCATACVAAEKLDRQWAGVDLSEKAYQLVRQRLASEVRVGSAEHPRLTGWNVTHRTDIPTRDDLAKLPNYRTHKHRLYGRQEGICNGCRILFPFRNMTVDHIVPVSRGGSDSLDNLQLLCGACNSMKGQRSQAAFLAYLQVQGITPYV
ncbi:MAG: DNA methyltransferase, partial [Chloroflexi bacterium]|nr:DNA methyltransferase [Chloroflexota bacterium]